MNGKSIKILFLAFFMIVSVTMVFAQDFVEDWSRNPDGTGPQLRIICIHYRTYVLSGYNPESTFRWTGYAFLDKDNNLLEVYLGNKNKSNKYVVNFQVWRVLSYDRIQRVTIDKYGKEIGSSAVWYRKR